MAFANIPLPVGAKQKKGWRVGEWERGEFDEGPTQININFADRSQDVVDYTVCEVSFGRRENK